MTAAQGALLLAYELLVGRAAAGGALRDHATVRNAGSRGGDCAGRDKRGDDSDGPKFQHDVRLSRLWGDEVLTGRLAARLARLIKLGPDSKSHSPGAQTKPARKLPGKAVVTARKVAYKSLKTQMFVALRRQRSDVRIVSGAPIKSNTYMFLL
jgi:hypothetical protein